MMMPWQQPGQHQQQQQHHKLPMLTCLAWLLLAAPVSAWGSLGHRTVAYLATLYSANSTNTTTTTTTHMLNALLLGQDVSEAALFADRVAHMPAYAYARPWHYINAAAATDEPPRTCGLRFARDCPTTTGALAQEGCVVSALANETARALDPALPRWQRGQSLRFVLNLVGDVHQPLHTVRLARGGSDIAVRFDGRATSLHAVWDALVLHKWRRRDDWLVDRHKPRDSEADAAYVWARELFAADHGGDGDGDPGDCVFDYADDGDRPAGMVDCVMQWAQQANQLVCDYVLRDGVDGVRARDLGHEYYQGAKDVVELQIRRAGRRLARWLDRMSEHWASEQQQRLPQQPDHLVVQG